MMRERSRSVKCQDVFIDKGEDHKKNVRWALKCEQKREEKSKLDRNSVSCNHIVTC